MPRSDKPTEDKSLDELREEHDLPSTLERSEEKAKRTYLKTLDSAEESYDGDTQRAHRAAWSSVKHSYEKVGDHWEPKDEKGPSDAQAAKGGEEALESDSPTAGGVDVRGHTKKELVERAEALGVKKAARMTKEDLGRAIAQRQG
jgi:cation transport regulator ChaB